MADKNKTLWGCCAMEHDNDDYINCTNCLKAYNLNCVTIVTEHENARYVLPLIALSSPPNNETGLVTREDVRSIMNDVLKDHMAYFVGEFNTTVRVLLGKELKTVKEEIKEMKDSMDFMSEKFDKIIKEHKEALENIKVLEEKSDRLQSTVMHLQARVNQLEQNARSNNIEIQCMPERKSENLMSIVKNIDSVIKCDVVEENVMRVTRIAKMDKDSPRPRSIVVEFKNQKLRDAFLAAGFNFNKNNPNDRLNTSHLGCNGNKTPIYICEHLSVANKMLHAAARRTATDKGFKFVWVRGGKVFLRKNENTGYIVVKNLESLASIK
ncbi:unnamed protein product [Euphydryas editha]|uniref:FP protein C-terminal domain-containing protein n=1 Tax=Euphydryas editha TaxID=104508 RepID=A0AAU9TVH3_EUPED|nr:unnamed protein product [Euphydryas editha]